MFKYTKASIKLVVEQFKLFAKIFKLAFLLFNISYYVFAIFMKIGIFWVNIALLALAVLYGIFDLFIIPKFKKKSKRAVKRSFTWAKYLVRLAGLGSAIYALWASFSSGSVNLISALITIVSLIWWVIQVFLEIIIEVIQSKADLIMAGWKKDVEDIKKPVTNVGNFFKKIKGEEIPESDVDQSKIDILDSYIVEEKEKEEQEKAKKKEMKKLSKQQKK